MNNNDSPRQEQRSKVVHLEDTLLLCVEPGSKQVFSLNLGTQETDALSKTIQRNIENKIMREEYKLSELTDRQKLSEDWHFENPTSERYRRSMVPFYLLEVESNRYPIYVDNSNLNSNLTTNFKIKNLTVHVTQAVIKELTAAQRCHSPKGGQARSSQKGGPTSPLL